MNKFLFVFLTLCILGQYTQAKHLRRRGRKLSIRLKKGINGDLHPKHRHLSEEGQLNLGISGRGYFAYRLRVQATDASDDPSQQVPTGGDYDQAYHEGSDKSATATEIEKKSITAYDPDDEYTSTTDETEEEKRQAARDTANTFTAQSAATSNFEKIKAGDKIEVSVVSSTVSLPNPKCARAGTYTVKSVTAGTADTPAKIVTNEDQVTQAKDDECEVKRIGPSSNADRNHGLDDKGDGTDSMEKEGNGAIGANGYPEAGHDGDGVYFSQVVYGKDGSLHVNRFGYLVDDNGLLLVSQGLNHNGTPLTTKNARFHIHIPSRADGIIVTPTGKVMAEELLGAAYSIVGQIMLARFENPQGLNVRIKMKSNCMAANEDGFALGNWCKGGDLDGKDHVYMSETIVSGPGIIGKPGEQGFGRVVR